ncbi:MAG: hypothetical protein ACJ72A_21815 [Nocardioidaceae bacterium]
MKHLSEQLPVDEAGRVWSPLHPSHARDVETHRVKRHDQCWNIHAGGRDQAQHRALLVRSGNLGLQRRPEHGADLAGNGQLQLRGV